MSNLHPQRSEQHHVRDPKATLQGQERQHSDSQFAFPWTGTLRSSSQQIKGPAITAVTG